jgi:hypothetical protein
MFKCPANAFYKWGMWKRVSEEFRTQQEAIYDIKWVEWPCTPRKGEVCEKCGYFKKYLQVT